MKRRRLFVADLVFLAATLALVYYVQHPEQLRYVRPQLQQFSIRTLRRTAEMLQVKAIKIENAYRLEVRP
jgi:hypothetical protein